MSRDFLSAYEQLLWGTMGALGVSASVERKILTAVGIQFGFSALQAVIPLLFSGTVRYALVGLSFLGAGVAFVNTVLIARQDIIGPIVELRQTADRIGAGEISDADVPEGDQSDEIGDLVASVEDMQSYLSVVTAQAGALARQEFDADALDEDVPGEFGDSLDRMATNLREYTTELEEMTTELEQHSEDLTQLIEAFGDAAERAREGDLTATIDVDALDGENGHAEVVENYNRLVETLAETVGELAEFSADVADVSGQVLTGVNEVDAASRQVSDSIQEIADGADSQKSKLEEVARETTDLSATIEEIASSTDEVAETAEQATARGRSGQAVMDETIEELRALETRSTEAAASVEELVEEIRQIDEIVSFIDGVADETDMLALNASIEAARTEGNEGFAVVADEVKALAEETKASAGEISERIDAIQTHAEHTVEDIWAMNDAVSEKCALAEDAMADFEAIVAAVEDANAGIQEIADATDQQADSTEQVAATIDEVASVSDQTATESDTVAAAAEEQTASVSEVRASVETLAEEAEELDRRLQAFEVDADEDTSRKQESALA